MPSIAVVSASYGGNDNMVRPPAMPGVDFVMVHDTAEHLIPPGWHSVYEPRPHLHSRMAAKYPKCFPWLYAPYADTVIWADASVTFTGEHLRTLVDKLPVGTTAMWRHPWRQDIGDEADVSRGMMKYANQPVLAQVRHYARCDMPLDYGMWATGFAVYTGLDSEIEDREQIAWRWLAEQIRWTYQDQLSLPYVCWLMDRRPTDIPDGWHLDNPWLTFRNHRSEA